MVARKMLVKIGRERSFSFQAWKFDAYSVSFISDRNSRAMSTYHFFVSEVHPIRFFTFHSNERRVALEYSLIVLVSLFYPLEYI